MSAVVESVNENRLNLKSQLGFDILFGMVPLLLLAPLLAWEFQLLWERPSMAFFPVPIFLAACFAIGHFRSLRSDHPQRVLVARGLYIVGVSLFGVSVWRLSPWLAHASLVLLFAAWAVERCGAVVWPRVMAWTALLTTSMRLPGDFDAQLQGWLVRQASAMLGYILDALAIPYLIRADLFSMRGLEFSISDSCAGMFSIHALASAIVLLLLLTHRSLLVGMISLMMVPLWVVVQQLLMLLAMVLLMHYGQRDASQGLDHTLIELGIFLFVVACGWSTMSFLARILLPVPAVDSQFEPEFWLINSVLCWPQPDPFAVDGPPFPLSEGPRQLSPNASRWMQRIVWVGTVGLISLGLVSTYRWMYDGFGGVATRLPPIQAEQLARTDWQASFPDVFDRWRKTDVSHQIQRIDGSDQATIRWHFGWQGQNVHLSVSLPFKSHPRLASKYEALGWRVLAEQTFQFIPDSPQSAVPESEHEPQSAVAKQAWTELRISNELGGRALAIATYHPLSEPLQSSSQPILEYQVLLFCESGEELTKPQLSELYRGFQLANEHLHHEVEPRLRELLGGAP